MKGDRKVGRPLSEDWAYAEELGVGYRTIKRLGGAEKLKKLSPEARSVLLRPCKGAVKGCGLEARGMRVCKPYEVQKMQAFEAYVQPMLEQRGLVKGA